MKLFELSQDLPTISLIVSFLRVKRKRKFTFRREHDFWLEDRTKASISQQKGRNRMLKCFFEPSFSYISRSFSGEWREKALHDTSNRKTRPLADFNHRPRTSTILLLAEVSKCQGTHMKMFPSSGRADVFVCRTNSFSRLNDSRGESLQIHSRGSLIEFLFVSRCTATF